MTGLEALRGTEKNLAAWRILKVVKRTIFIFCKARPVLMFL